jgi:hypothetical protein
LALEVWPRASDQKRGAKRVGKEALFKQFLSRPINRRKRCNTSREHQRVNASICLDSAVDDVVGTRAIRNISDHREVSRRFLKGGPHALKRLDRSSNKDNSMAAGGK